MKQYMLSVHQVEGGPPPSPEAMQKIYRDVVAPLFCAYSPRAIEALTVLSKPDRSSGWAPEGPSRWRQLLEAAPPSTECRRANAAPMRPLRQTSPRGRTPARGRC